MVSWLDLTIEDEYRRQKHEEENKKEQPRIELPLEMPELETTPVSQEEPRGVCIIDL